MNDDKLEQMLRQAQGERRAMGTLSDGVRAKVLATQMQPAARGGGARWLVAAGLLLAVGLSVTWYAWPQRERAPVEVAVTVAPSRFEIGGATIVVHLAAVQDARHVLVVWSAPEGYEATGVVALFDGPKYAVKSLKTERLADGRVVHVGTFEAKEGIAPLFEPPLLAMRARGTMEQISFAVSPGVMPLVDEDALLRAAQRRDF